MRVGAPVWEAGGSVLGWWRGTAACTSAGLADRAAAAATGARSGYAWAARKPRPQYVIRSSQREYKDGLKLQWFDVTVTSDGEAWGSAGSFDKSGAQQAAARQALERLGQLPAALAGSGADG